MTPTSTAPAPRSRRAWRAALIVPILLAMSACAKKAPLSTLEPKGHNAHTIANLINPIFAIAGLVFIFVQGGVLFVAWKFRRRHDDDGSLPEQVHGNIRLELAWTILPALILVGVGGASVADHPRPGPEAEGRDGGHGHRPAVVVGVPLRHQQGRQATTSSRPTTW